VIVKDIDALRAQFLHFLRVVDDITERGDLCARIGGGVDDLQRAAHAETEAHLIGEANLEAGHDLVSLPTWQIADNGTIRT